MSSTQNKHRRDRPRRVISPSYLIGAGRCTACKEPNHETEYCPSRRRKKVKTQVEQNNVSSIPQFLVPQQIYYDPFGNHPPMQTQQCATSQYFIMNPPFPSSPMMYESENILKVAKHSDIPDLDFPSLAGTSLDNCLLNSPLEPNPAVAVPSICLAQPPHEHVSQQTSQKNDTRKGDSTFDQPTQPPTKTLPFPCPTILFKPGEGSSYYDEATWSDHFGYSFASTNGG
jgi:hypothetical protein